MNGRIRDARCKPIAAIPCRFSLWYVDRVSGYHTFVAEVYVIVRGYMKLPVLQQVHAAIKYRFVCSRRRHANAVPVEYVVGTHVQVEGGIEERGSWLFMVV